jgi:hypothetical protein
MFRLQEFEKTAHRWKVKKKFIFNEDDYSFRLLESK